MVGVLQVAGHQVGAAPGLFDQLARHVRLVVLVEVGDHHVGALARVGQRNGPPDAAVGAGDERGHILEPAGA